MTLNADEEGGSAGGVPLLGLFPMSEDTPMFAGTLLTRSPLATDPEAPWWLPGTLPDEFLSPTAFRDEDEDLDGDEDEGEDDEEDDLDDEDLDDEDFDDEDFDDEDFDEDEDLDDLDDEDFDDLDEDEDFDEDEDEDEDEEDEDVGHEG
jgi:hypothetical protein